MYILLFFLHPIVIGILHVIFIVIESTLFDID